jgi:hypothetical protein
MATSSQCTKFVERIGSGSTLHVYLQTTAIPSSEIPSSWLAAGASRPDLGYDAFQAYAAMEFADNDLAYLRAINEYAGGGDRDAARGIFDRYISDSAKDQVNLSSSRSALVGLFESDEATNGENWEAFAPQAKELFEATKADIKKNITDPYFRFSGVAGEIFKQAKQRRRFLFA